MQNCQQIRTVAALVLGLLFTVSPVAAQPMRRALPSGELSGLELGIEGPLRVRPGERARWVVVGHEIVRDRDLRPARDARVEAFASYEPSRAVAEARTDAFGRAVLDVAIPATLPSGFALHFDLRSERARLTRRFRIDVAIDRSVTVSLAPLRARPRPNEKVALVGEVVDGFGAPVGGATVRLRRWNGTLPVGEPWEVATDARGRYVAFVRAPNDALRITAETTVGEHQATTATLIQPSEPPARLLLLRATAASTVVAPRQVVDVTVQVRDPRGLPISGAQVRGPALDAEAEEEQAITDARGLATLRGRAPGHLGDHTLSFSVVAPGLARTEVSAPIRVTRGELVVRALVEGGVLLPGLPSQVHVRVVRGDGQPLGDEELRLEVAGVTVAARSNEFGIASFDVPMPPSSDALDAEPDGCGGGTAVEARLHLGAQHERLCLPSDPDGVVRVRAVPVEGELEIAVRRRADVARAPVAITVLARESRGLVPVTAVGGDVVRVPMPTGPVVVRARALVTDALVEVRGSMVLVDPRRARQAEVRDGVVRADGPLVAQVLPEEEARHVGTAPDVLVRDTPFDDAVPAVWQDGRVVFVAAPDEPVTRGVLRDPWRQRAVYRTGRLALVLRAIEEEVTAASAEGELDDVAHREGNRWSFNRALLERAISGQPLGAEGARDLGGLPLSLDGLEDVDRALTFDNVARRITRARLLRVLVALRELVQERGLDLVFARRGDVTTWPLSLVEEGRLEEADLRDGWGHPMVLRASARPRFALFTPVAGYELLAPGPDGRAGTGDDVWDPLARVLPSGGLYAEAVDEDGLLMRLRGVALAHATLAELGQIFEAAAGGSTSGGLLAGWDDVPSRLVVPPLDPRPPAERAHAELVAPGMALDRLALPNVAARYVVVLYDGATPIAVVPHERGASAAFVGELPTRLSEGRPLTLRLPFVAFANLDGLRPVVTAEGASVEVDATPRTLAEGELGEWTAEVRAREGGQIALSLVDVTGRVHTRTRRRFSVVTDRVRRDRRGGALVAAGAPWRIEVDLPPDAADIRTELIALAPRRLHRDPSIASWARARPAMVAWAEVLGGGELDETARATLSASSTGTPIDRACASIVASALDEPRLALGPVEVSGDVRVDAALLAALAPSAPPPWQTSDDVFEQLRRTLRATTVTHADDAPVLARAAAALLLSDARDESGRAVLVRARELVAESDEALGEEPHERLAAAAALAIAAQRDGDVVYARALLSREAQRVWMALEAPSDAAFWWLAASAYGVLGDDATVVGAPFDAEGVATIPLPASTHVRAELATRGEGLVLARLVSRYARPLTATEGPFALSLEGHPGRADRPAALELVIEAREASASPELLVRLPAGSSLDPAARAALASGARGIEDAADGALLVKLAPLASGEVRRLPLRLRWLGAGERLGPGLAAWDAARPWDSASLPATPMQVE